MNTRLPQKRYLSWINQHVAALFLSVPLQIAFFSVNYSELVSIEVQKQQDTIESRSIVQRALLSSHALFGHKFIRLLQAYMLLCKTWCDSGKHTKGRAFWSRMRFVVNICSGINISARVENSEPQGQLIGSISSNSIGTFNTPFEERHPIESAHVFSLAS